MDIDPRLFDVRVVEKNIARGKITRAQHEAFLASLPDDAVQADNRGQLLAAGQDGGVRERAAVLGGKGRGRADGAPAC